MAAKVAPHVNVTLTGATSNGVATVAATTDIWPGQIGWLSAAGQTSRRVEVTEVRSATTFVTKLQPKIGDDNFAKGSTPGYSSGSASWDISAYNGGTFTAEEQVVETNPDGSKPVARL